MSCDFCDEFAGGYENAYSRIYGRTADSRALLLTDNFVVFPTIGQIVEGYLLIATRRHFRALADLPADMAPELRSLLVLLQDVLGEIYGRPCAFEHGTRTNCAGGCGIYHAHLHVVPVRNGIEPLNALKKRHPYVEISGLAAIPEVIRPSDSYLYYQASSGENYVVPVSYVPSQFVRRLLAEAVGEPNWDWRRSTQEDRLVSTLHRVGSVLHNKVDAA
jgi:diadenosine tetraphosphate (Ap4A) HIT family hydrolase